MSLGIILALLATLGWGAGDVFARKAMLRVSAGTVVVAMAALIVLALGIATAVTQGLDVLLRLPWYVYVLTAVMGFLAQVGGQFLYLQGMQRAGLTIAAPVISVVPLFAVTLAVVFGGERPGAATLVGAAIIVIGVVLVATDRGKTAHP